MEKQTVIIKNLNKRQAQDIKQSLQNIYSEIQFDAREVFDQGHVVFAHSQIIDGLLEELKGTAEHLVTTE